MFPVPPSLRLLLLRLPLLVVEEGVGPEQPVKHRARILLQRGGKQDEVVPLAGLWDGPGGFQGRKGREGRR
jgi:hypothetical protein